jgi:hypothetical protein
VSIEWKGSLRAGLEQFAVEVHQDTGPALAEGADVVLADARERVPKESDRLAASGKVDEHRGGQNTVAVKFDGPYARWIHEHLWFKHPRGGEAKFLETALLTKGGEALRVAGERLWRGRG